MKVSSGDELYNLVTVLKTTELYTYNDELCLNSRNFKKW